jgi:TDG/mug DNA glycosylase family protein
MYASGFPPISRPDARILILGSMPGRESLARAQYYAHPRNAFWPIICDLLKIEPDDYTARTARLIEQRVALWDVLQACFRRGSLDSDIEHRSIVTNDFPGFFRGHPGIAAVYFNGAKAEAVYRRRVLPGLPAAPAGLPLHRLPSTSPAYAAMSIEQKKLAWRVILQDVGKMSA